MFVSNCDEADICSVILPFVRYFLNYYIVKLLQKATNLYKKPLSVGVEFCIPRQLTILFIFLWW